MSAVEPVYAPTVREMTGSDLDSVIQIERASFSTPWSPASFRTLLDRGDASLWVATVDAVIVGYAIVWYVADEAELGNLAVDPAWRGRGLGRHLLDWALDESRLRGTARIFLEVRVSNQIALELYEQRGFVQVGLRRRYYRTPVEDARVMCLDLSL